MRLKSFHAKTMSEAMRMVRSALGEDAIIVATREDTDGKSVCVTAAVENVVRPEPVRRKARQPAKPVETKPKASPRKPAKAAPSPPLEDLPEDDDFWIPDQSPMESLTDALLAHSVPDSEMDQILSCASPMETRSPADILAEALETLYQFKPLPVSDYGKPLLLCGPPGAGKTLAIAKMAARGVMNGLKVCVITTDTVRAGGIEQLEAFTRLLRIDLQKAETPEQLAQCVTKCANAQQILIDTAGVNPFNPQDMADLLDLVEVARAETFCVLPGGGDASEAGDMGAAFSEIGVRRLLPTRLDISRRIGGLLAAARQGRMIFSDASDTPQVAEGLTPLTPSVLARFLMPEGRAVGPPERFRIRP